MKCRHIRAGANSSFPRLKIVVPPVRAQVSSYLQSGSWLLAMGHRRSTSGRRSATSVGISEVSVEQIGRARLYHSKPHCG